MPKILGIVNVTEDSFSDGGKYLESTGAIEHARRLAADGADAIDLGPASSRPDAVPVPAEEEIRRIAPVLDALEADGTAVSVDSPQAETQRWAAERHVAYLNDIRGFPDPSLHPVLAACPARLIVMHQIGERATREPVPPGLVLESIHRFFDERLATLERAGIARQRLIVDPGMGFFLGSDTEASLAVLRALPDLRRRFGLPVLVSVSRKSFLRRITGEPIERIGPATLAAELFAAGKGVDFIRTHDVRVLRSALGTWSALVDRSTRR